MLRRVGAVAGLAVALTACGTSGSESSPQTAASAQPQVNLGQQLARGSWRIAETCPQLRALLVRRGLAGAASLFIYPLFNHRPSHPSLNHLCQGRLFHAWGYPRWTRRFFGGARAGVVGMNDPHRTYYEEGGYSVVGQQALNLDAAGQIGVTFIDGDTIAFRDQVTSAQIRRMLMNLNRPSPALQALLFSYSGAPWVRVTGDPQNQP